ncbi:MAG: prepilin-type N-terminal cleavage/methylation domain-containing protein [bacterium]
MKAHGFTLIEAVIVISIISIMAAIAAPSMHIIPGFRLKAAARDMISYFQKAKVIAAQHNKYCAITFKLPLGNETFDYVIYLDTDQDLEYDDGEKVLYSVKLSDYKSGICFDPTKGGGDGITFAPNGNARPSFAFKPMGIPVDSTGQSFVNHSIYLKNERNDTKQISMNFAGRVKT